MIPQPGRAWLLCPHDPVIHRKWTLDIPAGLHHRENKLGVKPEPPAGSTAAPGLLGRPSGAGIAPSPPPHSVRIIFSQPRSEFRSSSHFLCSRAAHPPQAQLVTYINNIINNGSKPQGHSVPHPGWFYPQTAQLWKKFPSPTMKTDSRDLSASSHIAACNKSKTKTSFAEENL